MMAAIAITQPTEDRKLLARSKAPRTGGVRHPCIFCDSRGYSSIEKKEQQELFSLMSETEKLRQGNYRRERKLRKLENEMKKVSQLNLEMEDFFTKIPLGNNLPDEVNHSLVDEETPKNADAEIEERKDEEVPSYLKEKEMKLQIQVIHQQLKLITDVVTKQPLVSKNLWGHKSRTWPRTNKWKQQYKPSQKQSTRSPKPFSIPFCPKPIHLLARKAYLRPPPKLPPLSSQSITSGTPTKPLKCSSVQCDQTADDVQSREAFADALERAVNSGHADHPYYDHDEFDQDAEVPVTPWADHPYYDDLISGEDHDAGEGEAWQDHPYYDDPGLDEDQQDDAVPDETCEELAWEDHPYYDDLGATETEEDAADELDSLDHEEDQDESHLPDEAAPDDAEGDAWEDHPYYDTPEEHTPAESDVPEEDHSTYTTSEEEEELAWEDSPYY